MNFSQKCGSKDNAQPCLPFVSTTFSDRAPGDEVENEEVVAGLRRREAEAGHDRLQRMLHRGAPSSAGAARAGAVLRREEGRVDHHRAQEFIAEIVGKAYRCASAERVADHDRRSVCRTRPPMRPASRASRTS